MNNVVVYDGNRKIFDYHEFKESGSEWLRQRPTTGSSNMAAQTGSTYISESSSVEIATASVILDSDELKEHKNT